MLRFDGGVAARIGGEGEAAGGRFAEAPDFGQAVGREVVVPGTVADVLLDHHAVPFAAGHFLVVLRAKGCVAREALLHQVRPAVRVRIALGVEVVVHRLRVVHLVEVGQGLHREEDDLPVGVAAGGIEGEELPQGLGLEAGELVADAPEFAGGKVIGGAVHHFGRGAAAVFAVEVEDADGLVGLVLSEGGREGLSPMA